MKNQLPDYLLWLVDAPLFADKSQIENFFDAVVRPIGKEKSMSIEVTEETVSSLMGKLGVEEKVEPG